MYLRASTSSKYSRVPTGLGECLILQGRAFQYSRTAAIGVSGKDVDVFMVPTKLHLGLNSQL